MDRKTLFLAIGIVCFVWVVLLFVVYQKSIKPTVNISRGVMLSIVSPANGSRVTGRIVVKLKFSKPPSSTDLKTIWWTQLFVDSIPVTAGYNNLLWDTTNISNGKHTLKVNGYPYNSTTVIAKSSISVVVKNVVGPTASPTLTTKPTPTSSSTILFTPTAIPTSKPSSTSTATNIPTPVTTPTRTSIPTISPTAVPIPSGATIYVSPNGSDVASGSSAATPWRTIQKAANTAQSGQTISIASGSYNERVSITKSGTPSNPITLSTSGAKLLGFDITGNNWVIDGFDISTQTNGNQGHGIYIAGSASNITIKNSYIHELCHEGIFMESGVSHISVLNNKFWRNEMAAVQADGMYDLIQGNEVWDTQQYAMNAGGIYAGCTIAGGADADAFRFFGQHNIFRSNYAHDIYHDMPGDPHPTNPNPHTDCFQTWGSTAMTVSDILIERNLCRWPGTNQFQLASINATTPGNIGVNEGWVTNVTYQNNLFSNMGQGINIEGGVGTMNVYNNTFVHIAQEGLVCNGSRTSADQIINNIFYDVGDGGDSYTSGCQNSTFEQNDFYMPRGAPVGTYPNVSPYLSLDPQFVNYGDSTGAGADFHLLPTSPLKTIGIVLPQVTDDFYGTSRVGAPYSIGAVK